jgi:hypothetical protein
MHRRPSAAPLSRPRQRTKGVVQNMLSQTTTIGCVAITMNGPINADLLLLIEHH